MCSDRLFRSISPCHLYDLLLDVVIPEEELKEYGFLFFENEDSGRAVYKKNQWSHMDFMPENDNTRKCLRCSRLFNRLHSPSTSSFFPTSCQYHPQKTLFRNGFSIFPCCGTLAGSSRGCVIRGFHVHKQPSESVLTQFVATPKPVSANDYRSKKVFAIDVEMINTVNGFEAARVSLISHQGRVIMDEYVKPEGRIVHLNTEFSGIQMRHLEGARTLEQFLLRISQTVYLRHRLKCATCSQRFLGAWGLLEHLTEFHRMLLYNEEPLSRAELVQMRAAASGSTPSSQISEAPPTTAAPPPLGTSAESTPSFLEQPPVVYSSSTNGTPKI